MGVERVDYYSDEEYRQAKMMEEQERREQEEIQRAMEEEMVFEQLLGEYRQLRKDYKESLEALRIMLISQDCEWENRNMGHDWAEACQNARRVINKAEGDN